MIRITEEEYKNLQPGIGRVFVIPDMDSHVDSSTGIQVVRDESEQEFGRVWRVSPDVWKHNVDIIPGAGVVYAKTSMEVFEVEVEGQITVRIRSVFWQDIAGIINSQRN